VSDSAEIPRTKKVKSVSVVDKQRKMGRRGFEETFRFIFEKVQSELDSLGFPLDEEIDFSNPEKYAELLEGLLFEAYNVDRIPTSQVNNNL
jgi:hypothetical protein